jgi:Glycosyl hydrolase family 115
MKKAVMRSCFRSLMHSTVVLCIVCLSPVFAQDVRPVRIDRNTAILISPSEPGPVQLAAQDLASDMMKVFGVRPRIVHERRAGGALLVIESSVPASANDPKAPESFSLRAARASNPADPQRPYDEILLRGADMRGTMYAIYTFSQEVLGVDPMYFWTDHAPKRRDSILLPANYSRSDPGPLYRFRGFFINDEDLLTGWAPGKASDHSGISLEVWNRLFETILRLKGNMVAPGTWIFPDDGQVKLVADRGLLLSQHHATPLGVNVARWPRDIPYDFTQHPEIIERAWENAVNTYEPEQQVLWEVGLRGLSDAPYSDPSVLHNDKALGERISQVIADQMRIVRKRHPDALFVTDLWAEGNRLMQEGVLKIPREVITVWSDTGYGKLQDDGQIQKGQGAYLHVAMMNNEANQLTEMVPLDRLLSETKRLAQAGATQFYLVNTSDVRPVAMSARAVMEAAWGSLSAGQADDYYQRWAKEEFGAAAAGDIAAIYPQYFAAPAHTPGGREYGDQMYHTEARKMLLDAEIDMPTYLLPDQSPRWQTPFISGLGDRKRRLMEDATRQASVCSEAQPRWQAVYAKALLAAHHVEPERRNFYQAQVLTMISINMESNNMLLHVARAVLAHEAGHNAIAEEEIRQAEASLDRLMVAEKYAQYGKWRNWYHGDWLTGVVRTRAALAHFERFLADPQAPVSPPINWNDWEAYYHILHYEGDRTVNVQ